jgi:hypothetical protein
MEESEAEFTEEQIKALSLILVRVTSTTIEEAFANWKGSQGGGGGRGR